MNEKRLALMIALATGQLAAAQLAAAQARLDAAFPDAPTPAAGGRIVTVFPADKDGKRRTVVEALDGLGGKTPISDDTV